MAAGASPEGCSTGGSALHQSVCRSHCGPLPLRTDRTRCTFLLVQVGASLEARSPTDGHVLMHAVKHDLESTVKFIIRHLEALAESVDESFPLVEGDARRWKERLLVGQCTCRCRLTPC